MVIFKYLSSSSFGHARFNQPMYDLKRRVPKKVDKYGFFCHTRGGGGVSKGSEKPYCYFESVNFMWRYLKFDMNSFTEPIINDARWPSITHQ